MSFDTFELPEGGEVGTGLHQPSPATLYAIEATHKVFGEDNYLDRPDIQRLLQRGRIAGDRKKHRKWLLNQSQLGKCNPSAVVTAMHQSRDNAGQEHVPLSDCDLYIRVNGGQDEGSDLKSTFDEAKRGIAPRQLTTAEGKKVLFPGNAYRLNQVDQATWSAARQAAPQYKSWEPQLLPSKWEAFVPAVASAVARGYPIIFAWDVARGISERLKNGFVQQGRGVGNHANVIHSGEYVGGDELIILDDQNSWGPTTDPIYGPMGGGWGEYGFGRFTMESFFQCRRWQPFWVLVGTNLAPADNPLA